MVPLGGAMTSKTDPQDPSTVPLEGTLIVYQGGVRSWARQYRCERHYLGLAREVSHTNHYAYIGVGVVGARRLAEA